MNLIGIGFRARAGKDTIGNHLVNKHGYTKLSFAKALYEECENLILTHKFGDPWFYWYDNRKWFNTISNSENLNRHSIEYLKDWLYSQKILALYSEEGYLNYYGMKKKDPQLLQAWGTDFRRERFSKTYWIDQVKKEIKELRRKGYENIVITDVRFNNEFEFIKKMKGEIWRVDRYDAKGNLIIDLSRDSNHLSETELKNRKFDLTIKNDGTIETLYSKIDEILIKKRKRENQYSNRSFVIHS